MTGFPQRTPALPCADGTLIPFGGSRERPAETPRDDSTPLSGTGVAETESGHSQDHFRIDVSLVS
ncbi:hypothetical protein SCOCK_30278 [Actinacidiphila cocklensis]|uniref:Uncharacterized protein n=1 Tax=Actinacidiphila cocklensis TaxID=887465 RepID=A0A9W4GS37_9ACTN|nr:hypothetical protein SCOCK_30278 [Actinacidiphila cocklensis]